MTEEEKLTRDEFQNLYNGKYAVSEICDKEFHRTVCLHAKVMMRSPKKQLLYWARLGKACEDCPNHKYAEIRNDLLYMESDGEEI